jgi:hypothetical protein
MAASCKSAIMSTPSTVEAKFITTDFLGDEQVNVGVFQVVPLRFGKAFGSWVSSTVS